MPRTPKRPAELVKKIFRATDVVRQGLLTRAELRSSQWKQVYRGVYADSAVPITHHLLCQAIHAYFLPEGGTIAGRSAAHLYGVLERSPSDEVEVLSPKRFGPVRGVAIHLGEAAADEVVRRDGMSVTSPARTCYDLARWLDLVEAVIYLDIMVSKGLVTCAQLLELADRKGGSPGSRQLRRAVSHVDAGAESPQESKLRVRLVLAGVPAPVTQFEIIVDGRLVGRVDLAWPELKLALEYDGRWHADPYQLERDRKRLNGLLGADWLVLHFTARDLKEGFDSVVRQVREAMASRAREAATSRSRRVRGRIERAS